VLSKYEALGSIPSIENERRRKRKREEKISGLGK
jgi:hypothetical protein